MLDVKFGLGLNSKDDRAEIGASCNEVESIFIIFVEREYRSYCVGYGLNLVRLQSGT